MGINFVASNAADVFNDAPDVERSIRERFGNTVPLGSPGTPFSLPDEMGWSWWSELKHLASEKLGPASTPAIHSIDAWRAVFLDAPLNGGRDLLWPEGKPNGAEPEPRPIVIHPSSKGIVGLIRRLLGKPQPQVPPEIENVMKEMLAMNGARPGERKALQVASLREAFHEASTLLTALGCDPSPATVSALMETYSKDDNKVDDDPGIQCLCHLWLTASHALNHRQPMWLVK